MTNGCDLPNMPILEALPEAPSAPPNAAELRAAGQAHVQWLESLAQYPLLEIKGLNAMQVYAYELVQLLNHAFLRWRLSNIADSEMIEEVPHA